MNRTFFLFLTALLVLGCSGGSLNPSVPSDAESIPNQIAHSQATPTADHYILGMWDVYVSEDHQSVEAIPIRLAAMHFNALKFIEQTPCATCMKVLSVQKFPPNILRINTAIDHPFPGDDHYSGFDLRGILITPGNYTFPASGRSIAWGSENPRLINVEGYSTLFNPTDFPENLPVPPILKYQKGKYATNGNLSATLNPYICYTKYDERRIFKAEGGTPQTMHQLQVPTGALHFGYAIDVCWMKVEGPIDNPIYDFPPEANCLEAYKIIAISPSRQLAPQAGSNADFGVEVFDHQGIDTISKVTVEAPDLFDGTVELSFAQDMSSESALYKGQIINEKGASEGIYPILIKVTDTQSDLNLGNVAAWYVHQIGVSGGWARIWGDGGGLYASDVSTDADGNAWVAGLYFYDSDFESGPDIDIRPMLGGSTDAYLSKFDSQGKRLLTVTWGGNKDDIPTAVQTDSQGNVYTTGYFNGQTDLDPGPGEDPHQTVGWTDVFVSKLDQNGALIWGRAWGSITFDYGYGIAVDGTGNVYVSGDFGYTADFDPGPGTEERTSNGLSDAFLVKFDSMGNYQWARTWGGSDHDNSGAIDFNSEGNVCVFSQCGGPVDLDPGSGVFPADDTNVSAVSEFNPDGEFQTAVVWGGSYGNGLGMSGLAFDSSGSMFAAGLFKGPIDFDPGSGSDVHNPQGYRDPFLLKLDPSGNYLWGKSWGNDDDEEQLVSLALDTTGNAHVLGSFDDVVDFDPGAGVFELTSYAPAYYINNCSCYMSKFDGNGNFIKAISWGQVPIELLGGIDTDGSNNVYAAGTVLAEGEYDPGAGIEILGDVEWDGFLLKTRPDLSW